MNTLPLYLVFITYLVSTTNAQPCASSPCIGGSCVDDIPNNTYNCTCFTDFVGPTCDTHCSPTEFYFPTTNDHLQQTPVPGFTLPGGEFSICLWSGPTAVGNPSPSAMNSFLQFGSDLSNPNQQFEFGFSQVTGNYRFQFGPPVTGSIGVETNTWNLTIATNRIHSYCVTVEPVVGNTYRVRLLLDGQVMISQNVLNVLSLSPSVILFGWFPQLMDDVRVWNRALSPAEIQTGFLTNVWDDTQILAEYLFSTEQQMGTVVLDTSGNNFNLNFVGCPEWYTCSFNCTTKQCQFGSTCMMPVVSNDPFGSTCTCPPQRAGYECQNFIGTYCTPASCLNGGTCIDVAVGCGNNTRNVTGSACQCPSGFVGTSCQETFTCGPQPYQILKDPTVAQMGVDRAFLTEHFSFILARRISDNVPVVLIYKYINGQNHGLQHEIQTIVGVSSDILDIAASDHTLITSEFSASLYRVYTYDINLGLFVPIQAIVLPPPYVPQFQGMTTNGNVTVFYVTDNTFVQALAVYTWNSTSFAFSQLLQDSYATAISAFTLAITEPYCAQQSIVFATVDQNIYYYQYVNSTSLWVFQPTIVFVNLGASSISLTCDQQVIGGQFAQYTRPEDGVVVNSGTVIVYTHFINAPQILVIPDAQTGEACGHSVSIRNTTLVVGCPNFDKYFLDEGRMLRYSVNVSSAEIPTVYNDYCFPTFQLHVGSFFGQIVSTHNNIVLASAPLGADPVYLFGPACNITCENAGLCVIDEITNVESCNCTSLFGGPFCEIPLNACNTTVNPCNNNGTCVNLGLDFICNCTFGFTGPTCNTTVALPCASGPCLNGGTCISNIQFGNFTCVCPIQFVGTVCTVASPCFINPCDNGGTCNVQC